MLAPVRTIAPALDLVTAAEIKAHLRVDFTDDDTLVTALRDAVVSHLDGWSGILGRCLLTQTWRQDFDGFPAGDLIRLPMMPVTAVSGITYRDASDVQQTLSTNVYAGPFHDGLSAFVTLKYGQVWPNTYTRTDAVAVTFAVGYATAADVPKAIRQAALLMIGDLYENRETVQIGSVSSAIQMTPTVDALLGPYRRIGI